MGSGIETAIPIAQSNEMRCLDCAFIEYTAEFNFLNFFKLFLTL